ncbi:MAG: hypothetical protein U9Q33_12550 [Campylobacterota bacterium]|nr:hypothetical protein [Campylobacterota bacterium]
MSGLQKLTILDADAKQKKILFEAPFNPTEISFNKTVEWKSSDANGGDIQPLTFQKGLGETFDLSLFLDTTSNPSDDVYSKYTSKIDKLAKINNEKHRPPLLHVIWGRIFVMQCVLESIDYDFTRFKRNGMATRGTAKLKFKQVVKFDEPKVNDGELQSPDHTKVRILREGDSLQSLAYHEYEDVAMWKILAEHNKIEDPMNIPAGTMIEIPALED